MDINLEQFGNLWIKVINKAIDDLALFIRNFEDEKLLSEDDWKIAQSAYCFLFIDNYSVPIDDYNVDVYCSFCEEIWVSKMSYLTQQLDLETEQAEIQCLNCKNYTSFNDLSYEMSRNQKIKTINLQELLSIWECKDVQKFREKTFKKIKELVIERRKTLQTRKKNVER